MKPPLSAATLYNELLDFLRTMGDQNSLNPKLTHVFALLQIHNQLTQADLHDLTQYSLSTISKSLQSLIELGIIQRKKKQGVKSYEYSVSSDKFCFIYRPFMDILDELEILDPKLERELNRLKKLDQKNSNKSEINFLSYRINSIRNYIEIQRRAISKQSRYSFFPEIINLSPYQKELMEYSSPVKEIETEIIQYLIRRHVLSYDDPVIDRILSYFLTRGVITQEVLEELTGYSRAMISRKIGILQDSEFVHAFPREYRKSLVYYLPSFSLQQARNIMKMDQQIIQKYLYFQKYLKWFEKTNLNTISPPSVLESVKPLYNVLVKMQKYMDEFRQDADILAQEYKKLSQSLSK